VVEFKTVSKIAGKEVDVDIFGAKSSSVTNEAAHFC
jgi:hypothetical protein